MAASPKSSPKSGRKSSHGQVKQSTPSALFSQHTFRHNRPNILGVLLAFGFLATITWLVVNEHVRLSGVTTASQLTTFSNKLQFTLKYWTGSVIWLIIATLNVGSRRAGAGAINPLAGNDHLLAGPKNIALNSNEQFIQSTASQLILITFLTGTQTVVYIPLINLFFVTGRVMFALGYPNFRSLGFYTSSLPTMASVSYVAYRVLKDQFQLF